MIVRAAEIADIARLSFGDPSRLATTFEGTESCAVVAVGDRRGSVIGYATGRLGVVHRTRRWLDIQVADDHRRRGVGGELFRCLSRLVDDRLFAAKALENSPAAEFCAALGGAPYQICPAMTLLRDDAALAPPETQDKSSRFVTVSGVDVGRRRLTALWLTQYEWVHRSWSPVDGSTAARDALRGEGEQCDLALSTVVFRDDEPLAAAFAFVENHRPEVVEIIAETVAPPGAAGVNGGLAAVHLAIGRSVRLAFQRGAERIQFDGHESDPHFAPIAAALPLTGGRTLLFEMAI